MQAQRRQRQAGLTRAGLANHAQCLPRRDVKASALHCNKLAGFKPAFKAWHADRVAHAQRVGLHDQGQGRIGWGFLHVTRWLAVHQFSGVGVLRAGKNRLNSALLDNHAVFHHCNAVGKAAHQVQVMGNHQHGHAVLALQVAQQIQNLRAHRHVEGGGWLIGQQQLGLASQRHSNHRALALAA